MGDKLNLYVFKRQPNSATAEACDVTYKEDWQSRSGPDNPIGEVQCGDSSFDLVHDAGTPNPSPHIFIKLGEKNRQATPAGNFTGDSPFVVAAIDGNQATFFNQRTITEAKAEAKKYLETIRREELTTSSETYYTGYGSSVEAALGIGYNWAAETSPLPRTLHGNQLEHAHGHPFRATEFSAELRAPVANWFVFDTFWRQLAATVEPSVRLAKTAGGTTSDDYMLQTGEEGSWGYSTFDGLLGVRLPIISWYNTLSKGTQATTWDIVLAYRRPFYQSFDLDGNWGAQGALPHDVKVSDSSWLNPFDLGAPHEICGGLRFPPLAAFGFGADVCYHREDLNAGENEPSMHNNALLVAITGSLEGVFKGFSEKEREIMEGDPTVTLSAAKEPTIIPAPPPSAPAERKVPAAKPPAAKVATSPPPPLPPVAEPVAPEATLPPTAAVEPAPERQLAPVAVAPTKQEPIRPKIEHPPATYLTGEEALNGIRETLAGVRQELEGVVKNFQPDLLYTSCLLAMETDKNGMITNIEIKACRKINEVVKNRWLGIMGEVLKKNTYQPGKRHTFRSSIFSR